RELLPHHFHALPRNSYLAPAPRIGLARAAIFAGMGRSSAGQELSAVAPGGGTRALAQNARILFAQQSAPQSHQELSQLAPRSASRSRRPAPLANSREQIFVSVGALGGAFVRAHRDASILAHRSTA